MSIFQPALDELKLSGKRVWGPQHFNRYLQQHGLTATQSTPALISVDAREKLHPVLREAEVMVLRLGRANPAGQGSGTAFALINLGDSLDDLFLVDADLVAQARPETFLPTATIRDLYSFHLLPQLSEANVLSYAFASGMISEALLLDVRGPMSPPATGSSILSFSFRPHPLVEETLTHDQGQVEVDAMFIAQRGGRRCLFVLEAKLGPSSPTLAKHKLAYPILGLIGHIPLDMAVIPVYARFSRLESGLQALITECRFDGSGKGSSPPTLSDLAPERVRLLTVPRDVAVGFGHRS